MAKGGESSLSAFWKLSRAFQTRGQRELTHDKGGYPSGRSLRCDGAQEGNILAKERIR